MDRSHQRPRLADLSGEKWAGAWLAVGVLCITTLFLAAALLYLRTAEPPACKMLASLGGPLSTALTEGKPVPEALSAILQQCTAQQQEFFTFWLDMVQRILINTLLPVLTALLGYIFGTQQVRAAQE